MSTHLKTLNQLNISICLCLTEKLKIEMNNFFVQSLKFDFFEV